MKMIQWENLRKQARKLENEIDLKLVSFSKFGTRRINAYKKNESDVEPLLSPERMYDSLAVEIEQLIANLSEVNKRLREVASVPGSEGDVTTLRTLQRHCDILVDYSQEFHKTKQNYKAQQQRENLIHSVRKDIDHYKNSSGSNRVDLYMKENKHIWNSERMVDEQISVAVGMREHLVSQRLSMKRMQTRLHNLGIQFPAINSLVQRIDLTTRRDSLILGVLVASCTFLFLLYLFH